MVKQLKKGMFPFLIGLSALSVSSSAAFYSVSGLSKLFAGAPIAVILMASSLEFAKLVTASLLYQYWNTINKTLRTYLSIATVLLVLITSMGIYGFLSAAYMETYSKLSVVKNQKSFIQQKIDFYQTDVDRYDVEIGRISNNISLLSNAKASNIQVRDTSVVGGVRTTISTTELRMAQNRINVEEKNRKSTQEKRIVATDSLQKFQLQVLDLSNNNDVAGELGPLQYLSSLTGYPMDKIINVLLLIIIFVFDPLAISLVVAANFAFEKSYPKKKYRENLYAERVEVFTPEDLDEEYPEPNEALKEAVTHEKSLRKAEGEYDWSEIDEERMNIIGQNGNTGEHYEEFDLNKDGKISQKEIDVVLNKMKKIQTQMGGNLNPNSDMGREMVKLQKFIDIAKVDDSLTITY